MFIWYGIHVLDIVCFDSFLQAPQMLLGTLRRPLPRPAPSPYPGTHPGTMAAPPSRATSSRDASPSAQDGSASAASSSRKHASRSQTSSREASTSSRCPPSTRQAQEKHPIPSDQSLQRIHSVSFIRHFHFQVSKLTFTFVFRRNNLLRLTNVPFIIGDF